MPNESVKKPTTSTTATAATWSKGMTWSMGMTLLLCAAFGLGCNSNRRISVRELIELERELGRDVPSKQVAHVATTQPIPGRGLVESNPYRLVVGDEISINILGMNDIDETLPTLLGGRVRSNGNIPLSHGLDAHVAGLTLEEAEEAIEKAYVPRYFKNIVVTITVLVYNPTTVILYGAVLQPGPAELQNNQRNVVYAIAGAAGGWSINASGRVQVKSARGEEYDAFYDLRTPAGVQQAASAPPLESGDVVIAEAETASTVYFTGLLAGGGPVAFTAGDPVSFLQAMAMSGGRDPITDPNFGLLRRKLDTGEVVEVELKLKDLEEGREPDFMMAAGDLVTVPHTWRTRLWEFVNQSVRFSAGASTSVNYDPLTQDRFDRQLDQTVNRNGGNFAAPSLVGLPNFFSPAFPSAPSPP